ncbi:Myotubularin-like phosphatase domain [Trinorchestia longiramus]|nr:Myotubularin-like phosphatase domain [Trinorchestia longiramus]
MTAALSRLGLADAPTAPTNAIEDSLDSTSESYFDVEPTCSHLDVETPLGKEADEGEEEQGLRGRCVLVLAPEGCGKTQLLRHLHSAFCSVLYGKTSRNLARLFEIASHRKPCLVLIDDVDQVPGVRRLPSVFLSSPAEVVMVCTAREEAAVVSEVRELCTARLVLIKPLPHTRRSILTAMMHDAELCCSPDTLAAMVESTRGCSGQDLNDLVLDLRTECGTTGAVRRQDMVDALRKLKMSLQRDAARESSSIVSQPRVYSKKSMKVCGYEDLFSRLVNYVRLTLQHSALYEKLEMSPPSRILLFGPPGCGKTWLVKALAEKFSLTVRTVTRADVFSKYFGESEQNLDGIFNKALASSPCLLHFPGFDGLASVRAHDNHPVEGRVVNLLKSRLDGTIRLKGLVVVAETSRPELLDSAIIRRGRFLAYEYVGLPDDVSRREIIRLCSPELCTPAAATITALTEGFTVSEVVNACREVRTGGEARLEDSVGLVAPCTTKTALRRNVATVVEWSTSCVVYQVSASCRKAAGSKPENEHELFLVVSSRRELARIGKAFRRGVDIPEEETILQPDLFYGEVIIAFANNVLKFSPGGEQNTGISGTLFVTNLRLALVTTLPPTPQEEALHHLSLSHLFLGAHDVELCLVSSVCLLDEHNQRRKTLLPEYILPDKVPGIQLILKNFRVLNFSFKFSPIGEDGKVIRALLHHSNPSNVDLLFLTPGTRPPETHIPTFQTYVDWQNELERTGCPNWRITQHNESFNLCATYPPVFVVPHGLVDQKVEKASRVFREYRPLLWLWGAPGGAALVVMAQVSPNIPDTISLNPRSFGQLKMSKLEDEAKSLENLMIGAIHRSNPCEAPAILDLDKELPQPAELHAACNRLRALHLPEGASASSYLSRFENSKWLSYVSRTLSVASKAAHLITEDNRSVILQEDCGRDAACVVSSLVEVLCDPFARTVRGLHCVIAKHWVALGHQFTVRLGHTRRQKHLQGECWLLLLDCLHQVCVQQPRLLQYTPCYLAALWGAAHCPLYTTCLFDCTNSMHTTISRLHNQGQECVEFWELWCWWASCKSQAPPPTSISAANSTATRSQTISRLSNSSTTSANGASVPLKINSHGGAFYADTSFSSSEKSSATDSGCSQSGLENDSNVSTKQCSKSCRIARRHFLSPLFVQDLFDSLLSPGALDRITDEFSAAHHTWQQIERLLFPHLSHLPYNGSRPPDHAARGTSPHATPRPPTRSQLPPPIVVDFSIPRLSVWVELFGRWLPEADVSYAAGPAAANAHSSRAILRPENTQLLFWDSLYAMYDVIKQYIDSSSNGRNKGAPRL